jgi:RNase H-fold protein (predicted Holliday junction resolvase)
MTLRAMSLDIGTRRIGVALSDSSYIIARHYTELTFRLILRRWSRGFSLRM